MERLARADLEALLRGVEELYAVADLAAFPAAVLAIVSARVPAVLYAYNEVNPRLGRALVHFDPPVEQGPKAAQAFEHHLHEHPIVAHVQQTGDGSARRLSDFLTRRQLHRTGLYREVYRPLDTEYQLAVSLVAPPLIVGIVANRDRRDFSGRDRTIMELLRPHLARAYRTAEANSRLDDALAAGRRAVVLLDSELRVAEARGPARRWLAEYFDRPGRPGGALPEPAHAWVDRQRERLADADLPPLEPLAVERGGRRLVVRYVPGRDARQASLLLEEHAPLTVEQLAGLGVRRREAEVLLLLAPGKTDAEIAALLGISPRTVQSHLQRIYARLDAHTRAAALARVFELLREEG